jgi:hypothetical protein
MHGDLICCNSFGAWGFNFLVVSFGVGFVDAWGYFFAIFLDFVKAC